jgi:hypothetical protein
MLEKDLLYKILDFEVNWNKYHLVKQYGYIFRLQQIIDIFDKLEISDNRLLFDHNTKTNLKMTYNFVKKGEFLSHIEDKKLLQGVSFRLKNNIQNTILKNKYPHFIDIDFNYEIIFKKLLYLRFSLYKLQINFDTIDHIESIEYDLEQIFYEKTILKISDEINEIDSILCYLLNPFNNNINKNEILHYNIDFSQFNIF